MRTTNQRFQLPLVAYLCTLIFVFTAVDARAASGDLNCDNVSDVFDVQLLIMKALSLPFAVEIDANQDGIHDDCPNTVDTPGIISVGGAGDITCADMIDPFPLQNCDLPLSDFGASAPENALYDDTATYAELCPESLSECFSDVEPASYCGTDNMAWDDALNQCIVEPVFATAKAQCETDLSTAQANPSGGDIDLSTQFLAIDGNIATPTPLTICVVNEEFESIPSTLSTDRVCTPLTQCASNQYEAVPPTPTSDRVCKEQVVCAVYQNAAVEGTPTSPQVCENKCTATQWFDVSTTTCQPLTECVGDEVQEVAPTPTSDRQCGTSCMCDVATGKLVGDCPNELTMDTILENKTQGVYLATTQERICMAISPYYYKSGEYSLMWSSGLEHQDDHHEGYVQYPNNSGSFVYNSYIYHTGDMGFWESVPVLVNWLNDRGVGIIGTPGEGF
jgi:hypothetical protein